ncbi:hypothetical protein [Labedaea rhizosphaerae]|uniref:Uncharacterized protein n=1 Tax=Labedaea rhizosphaerae TaxID=598644 RepID=A0A4R6SFJ7_LABRH|nr:hypothetical protein [Labedaea rhizosphaerae]TDQ00473.1 hypothetical protein EV186_102334 [Labedaea rhizosphaerae]
MHDEPGYRDVPPPADGTISLGEPGLFITGADQLEVAHTLPAIAARLLHEVGELRDLGEFPAQASVRVDIKSDQDQLDITLEGLSPESDPDRVSTMTALRTVFELAGHLNLIDVTGRRPPWFTLHMLAVDRAGRPYAGLVGTGMGDIHPADNDLPRRRT